jgi:hypothetical protein
MVLISTLTCLSADYCYWIMLREVLKNSSSNLYGIKRNVRTLDREKNVRIYTLQGCFFCTFGIPRVSFDLRNSSPWSKNFFFFAEIDRIFIKQRVRICLIYLDNFSYCVWQSGIHFSIFFYNKKTTSSFFSAMGFLACFSEKNATAPGYPKFPPQICWDWPNFKQRVFIFYLDNFSYCLC